jgi:hypothetical protein
MFLEHVAPVVSLCGKTGHGPTHRIGWLLAAHRAHEVVRSHVIFETRVVAEVALGMGTEETHVMRL